MKWNVRWCVLGLCLMLFAAGAQAQELAEKIDAVMTEFTRLDLFSGAVLVAEGGDIVYAEAFGEANKDHHVANILETRFNIGSIGKTFTGVAIMQLVERGKLELTAPVVHYLPDFPYGEGITIHHLLSHTSGMYNYMAHPEYQATKAGLRNISDFLPLIYDQQLVFDTPGERFAYSNSGIVVLGAVIEKVSGQPYAQFIRENILAPAGMTDTGINFWDQIVPNRAMGYTKGLSGGFTAAIFAPCTATHSSARHQRRRCSRLTSRATVTAGGSQTKVVIDPSGTAVVRPESAPVSCDIRTTTSPSSCCQTTQTALNSLLKRSRQSSSANRMRCRNRRSARCSTGR
jgi:CubicO group peptidase (beta-lactamase class C family)